MGIAESVPINAANSKIDFVAESSADFIRGNYTVFNIGDMNNNIPPNISSNVNFDFDRLNNATFAFRNIDIVPANYRSNYDIDISGSAFNAVATYVIGNNVSSNYDAQSPLFINWLKYGRNPSSFVNNYFENVNSNNTQVVFVKYGAGAMADVFVQAASAALFKKINKMSAISNDYQIRNQNLSEINNRLNVALRDQNANFHTSAIFADYFNTNRYQGNTTNLNTKINYQLNDVNFAIAIQLNGNVFDPDVSDWLNDGTKEANILNIFGNYLNDETRVQIDGSFQINFMLRFKHVDG